MLTFNRFITENKAKEKAIELGLKYSGFGYWKDPKTGKTTHKSKGDDLVPVSREEMEQEMAQDEEKPASKKSMKSADDVLNPKIDTSQLGTMVGPPPDPEEESEWIPGPFGDNCVTDDAPPENIAKDSYVGKTNDTNWVAGPHGSNFKTDSFDKLSAKILTPKTDVHQRVVEELTMMLEEKGVDTQIRDLRSKNTKPDDGTNTKKARKYLKPLNTRARNKVIDDVEAQVNKPNMVVTKQKDTKGDVKVDSWGHAKLKRVKRDPSESDKKNNLRLAKKFDVKPLSRNAEARMKDEDKIAELNALAKRLSMDPEYDLSDDNLGNFIGSGSFGSVHDSKDGKYVIKKGEIGLDELKVLYKMRDNPNFPSLVSAVFDTPFTHQSSVKNNPTGSRPRKQTNYWNPGDMDDMKEFDERFPTAKGTFAMTKARGIPFHDAMYQATPEVKEKLKQSYWKSRAALHRQGIVHNDMADRNVFVDPETGEVDILDFGMAKKDPKAALFAALGGMNPDHESQWLRDAEIPSDFRHPSLEDYDEENPVHQNIIKVRQYLLDKGINLDEEDVLDALSGGIKLKDADIERFADALGIYGSDEEQEEQIYEIINMLYDNIDGVSPKQKELENRMSSAFTLRAKDAKRVERGNPPLNKSKVVPLKNLDFDD